MADPRTTKADRKAEQAREKAMRPWYKKKRFVIPLALVVLIVIASAVSGGGGDDEPADSAAPAGDNTQQGEEEAEEAEDEGEATLFPGRPDAQREDQERNIGEEVETSGYTAVVNTAEFVSSISEFEDAGYVKINVTITNTDDRAQPYNLFDWRLQSPGGTVQDPTFTSAPTLESGDLVSGGEVAGDVYFEVGDETGDFFVIYKPDPFDAARGVWKVTV
jgi:hypothetical protein